MAVPTSVLLGLDSIMEVVNFAISIAIGYQALKAYRFTKQRLLVYLHFSFVLLAVGFLIDGLTGILVVYVRLGARFLLTVNAASTILFFAEVIAFGLIIFAHLGQSRALAAESISVTAVALIPPTLLYNSIFELVLVFLTAYIAAQSGVNYSIRRNLNSLLVFLGFTLQVFGHVFFMILVLGGVFFALGHITQLLGFLMLLIMLVRVNRGT